MFSRDMIPYVRELISFDVVSADDTFNVEVVSVKGPITATTVVIQGRLKDAHSQSPTRATWTLHYNTATDQHQIDISASGTLKSKMTLPTRQVVAESVMMRYKNGLMQVRVVKRKS